MFTFLWWLWRSVAGLFSQQLGSIFSRIYTHAFFDSWSWPWPSFLLVNCTWAGVSIVEKRILGLTAWAFLLWTLSCFKLKMDSTRNCEWIRPKLNNSSDFNTVFWVLWFNSEETLVRKGNHFESDKLLLLFLFLILNLDFDCLHRNTTKN